MVPDIKEQDHAGNALKQVHPVAPISIGADIGARLRRDEQAVGGVIEQRQPDGTDLEEDDDRIGLQIFDDGVEALRAAGADRLEVRVQVLDEEGADGNEAGQLEELFREVTRACGSYVGFVM